MTQRLSEKSTPLPNLFVAGAQKSGTTSLHRFLESHPDIFFPSTTQELHFFDIESNFRKGVEWYKEFFAGWTGQRYVAQTSPMYMYEPAVPGRIAAVVPGARLAFILRNPIDRAYSHYWHEVRYGWETLPFRTALEREKERLRGGFEARRHYSYVARGMYADQIKRFLKVFPRENIHVEITEEFSTDVDATAARIARFLNLSAIAFVQEDGRAVRNKGKVPRWPILQHWARNWHDRHPRLYGLMERVNLQSVGYPPMDSQVRKSLRDVFYADVTELKKLSKIDLSCWSDFA
jgi:hypothetical protein